MKNFIVDKDGVNIIIGENADVIAHLDFNFSEEKIHKLENRERSWDINIYDGPRAIGRAVFSAYQFMADGVERRTISLKHIELAPYQRRKGLSYDVAKFVLETVKAECDQDWAPVAGMPVLFLEKRNIKTRDKNGAFEFLRKIGARVLGLNEAKKPTPDQDITVMVIGEDISLQLIQNHLQRSARLE